MLYHTCTMVSSVDLAHYGISLPKDLGSGNCGTIHVITSYVSKIKSISFMLALSQLQHTQTTYNTESNDL